MDILKMIPELWQDAELRYVGRSKDILGLGNPWAIPTGWGRADRQVRHWVSNRTQAIDCYRQWFIYRLVHNYTSGMGYIGLQPWEQFYLSDAIKLARLIRQGVITKLGCFCVNLTNYVPVDEGLEQWHAEVLYKGCLLINEFEAKVIPNNE